MRAESEQQRWNKAMGVKDLPPLEWEELSILDGLEVSELTPLEALVHTPLAQQPQEQQHDGSTQRRR